MTLDGRPDRTATRTVKRDWLCVLIGVAAAFVLPPPVGYVALAGVGLWAFRRPLPRWVGLSMIGAGAVLLAYQMVSTPSFA